MATRDKINSALPSNPRLQLFILMVTLIFTISIITTSVENLNLNAQLYIKCTNNGDFLYFAVCNYPINNYIHSFVI